MLYGWIGALIIAVPMVWDGWTTQNETGKKSVSLTGELNGPYWKVGEVGILNSSGQFDSTELIVRVCPTAYVWAERSTPSIKVQLGSLTCSNGDRSYLWSKDGTDEKGDFDDLTLWCEDFVPIYAAKNISTGVMTSVPPSWWSEDLHGY